MKDDCGPVEAKLEANWKCGSSYDTHPQMKTIVATKANRTKVKFCQTW